MDEPRAYYMEWSKLERRKQRSYINAYIRLLERWYWWTYLQGGNGETDIRTDLWTQWGKERVGWIQRVVECICWNIYIQFSSVAQSCPTLCDPMTSSIPGLPVHHQLPEFTQIHVHQVRDAIQPSHPQSSPSPPAPNPSQHQSLFQWVNSSHEMAKLLEFQL